MNLPLTRPPDTLSPVAAHPYPQRNVLDDEVPVWRVVDPSRQALKT
jgi:hypothetical protein